MSRKELCWECGQPYEPSTTGPSRTMCPKCCERLRVPEYVVRSAEKCVESVDLKACESLIS